MPGEELAVIEGQVVEALAVRRPPGVVLEEARQAAVALTTVLNAKPKKVTFNGETYLEFEDWQTVGRFYGITAKIESTAFVEYGTVRGFSARAVAVRSDGMEISAAEAECLNDEEKWRSKTKYEWRDKEGGGREKVKVGEEPVPLFQLKSMAQTRASSKVLRNVLAWVVVLAGYKPTPAEELDGVMSDGHVANGAAPQQAPQATQTTQVPKTAPVVSGTGAPATTTAPSADGAEFVKSVTTPATEGKPTKVVMESGKNGTTFDKKLIESAKEALDTHEKAIAVFTESEKKGRDGRPYVNLTAFTIVGRTAPTAAVQPALPIPTSDGEPEGQPEDVLSVRQVKAASDGQAYWVIQSRARQYATFSEGIALYAEALRAAKKPGLFGFARKAKPNNSGFYCEVTSLTEVPAEETAPSPPDEALEAAPF